MLAVSVNSSVDNIGARRLQTVMERFLEPPSASALRGDLQPIADRRSATVAGAPPDRPAH
jgi:ATP-dependent protease HslVU (ClpYQ) ATPase subunit